MNPELASKKNLEFNNEILPAKNPVSGSEIFTDKISFIILLNSLLKKDLFDENMVAACDKQNIAASVFTVNNATEADRFIRMGAASVVTDVPQKIASEYP